MSYRGIISDITGTSWSTARIYSNPPPNCKHNASTPLVWCKHTSTLQSKPDWSLFLDPKACEQDIPASQSDIFTLSSHQSTQSSNSLLMVLVEEKINKSTPVQFCPGKWGGKEEKTFLSFQEIIWSPERWDIGLIQNCMYYEQSKDYRHNSAHYAMTYEERKCFTES